MSFKNLHFVFLVSLIALATMGSCGKNESGIVTKPTVIIGNVTSFTTGDPLSGVAYLQCYYGAVSVLDSAELVDSCVVDASGEFEIVFKEDSPRYILERSHLWSIRVEPADSTYDYGPGFFVLGETNKIQIELKQK